MKANTKLVRIGTWQRLPAKVECGPLSLSMVRTEWKNKILWMRMVRSSRNVFETICCLNSVSICQKRETSFFSVRFVMRVETGVICIIGHTAPNSQIAKGYLFICLCSQTHSSACFHSHYAWKAKMKREKEREKIVILMWRDQKRELNLNSRNVVLLSADSALATNLSELQLNHIYRTLKPNDFVSWWIELRMRK